MIYLKYRKKDGYVVSTHEQEPQAEESFAVAKSEDFKVGDEFQYFITVMEVDEDGVVTKHASVQQSPPAQELLERLAVTEQENTELKLALAELAESHEQEKTEMQLALAELAELVGGEANHG